MRAPAHTVAARRRYAIARPARKTLVDASNSRRSFAVVAAAFVLLLLLRRLRLLLRGHVMTENVVGPFAQLSAASAAAPQWQQRMVLLRQPAPRMAAHIDILQSSTAIRRRERVFH